MTATATIVQKYGRTFRVPHKTTDRMENTPGRRIGDSVIVARLGRVVRPDGTLGSNLYYEMRCKCGAVRPVAAPSVTQYWQSNGYRMRCKACQWAEDARGRQVRWRKWTRNLSEWASLVGKTKECIRLRVNRGDPPVIGPEETARAIAALTKEKKEQSR